MIHQTIRFLAASEIDIYQGDIGTFLGNQTPGIVRCRDGSCDIGAPDLQELL
jgi:hypothetical protein